MNPKVGELEKRIDELVDELIAEAKSIKEEAERKVAAIHAEANKTTDSIIKEANSRIRLINEKINAYNRVIAVKNGVNHRDKADRNKLGCIRDCLRCAGRNGATYEDITGALAQRGFPTRNNYRYTVVSKLRKEGKIIEREGRIYWADTLKP